ncbi:hypothetical protein DFH09DRAFT_1103145 [Mycena vulgaris]|nr:hypothetical protein DFH09DRAFT_1103145 [Mycena vulgaris]
MGYFNEIFLSAPESMKAVFSVLLSTLAVVSASYLEGDLFLRRGPNYDLFTRQNQNGSQPVLGNLIKAQLETAYAATCNATTSATGQSQILEDIQNTTANAVAIDVSPNSTLHAPFPLMCNLEIVQSDLGKTDGHPLGESQQWDLVFADVEGSQPGYFTAANHWEACLLIRWVYCRTGRIYYRHPARWQPTQPPIEFTTAIMPLVANLTGPIPTNISVEVLANYGAMAGALAAEAKATSRAFTSIINNMNDSPLWAGGVDITAFASVSLMAVLPVAAPFFIVAGYVALEVEVVEWAKLSQEHSSKRRHNIKSTFKVHTDEPRMKPGGDVSGSLEEKSQWGSQREGGSRRRKPNMIADDTHPNLICQTTLAAANHATPATSHIGLGDENDALTDREKEADEQKTKMCLGCLHLIVCSVFHGITRHDGNMIIRLGTFVVG